MANNDYTAQEALNLVLRLVREREPELARQIQLAIDAGKDIESESAESRKPKHVYRKTVRLSDEEAVRVAIDVLQAHFVEQPLFLQSAVTNFAFAAISPHVADWERQYRLPPVAPRQGVGVPKTIEVELQTETQISSTQEQTVILSSPSVVQIEEQKSHLATLRRLIDFEAR